jgi:hypothetical protein
MNAVNPVELDRDKHKYCVTPIVNETTPKETPINVVNHYSASLNALSFVPGSATWSCSLTSPSNSTLISQRYEASLSREMSVSHGLSCTVR